MDSRTIILNGFQIVENRNNLIAYYVREFKKAERDWFYNADDFFNNCQSKIDDWKLQISKTYETNIKWYKLTIEKYKNNEGVFYPTTSNIPFSEIDLGKYSTDTNRTEFERLTKAFAIFTINDVDIKIGLKLPDIIKIEASLVEARNLIDPTRLINLSTLSATECAIKYRYLYNANIVPFNTMAAVEASKYFHLESGKSQKNIELAINKNGKANKNMLQNVYASLSEYPDIQKAIKNDIDSLE